MSNKDNKAAALQSAVVNMEKRWGKGVIMRLGERSAAEIRAAVTDQVTSAELPGRALGPETGHAPPGGP